MAPRAGSASLLWVSATPYRDGLEAARRRLRVERENLEIRAASLGADDGHARGEPLAALRADLDRPVVTMADVERHERSLQAFAAALAGLSPPRAFPRAKLVLAAITLAAGLPVLLGATGWLRRYQHWHDACPTSRACEADGSCSPHLGHLDARVAAAACHPTSHAACRAAEACRDEGRCSLDGERCVATNDQDCQAATYCAQYDGACVARSGHCAPHLETSAVR